MARETDLVKVHGIWWKDDKRNGRGKVTCANGDVYEGEYKDNKKHGHGKYTWPDANVYEGEWRGNKRNGRGKYRWTNGSVYEGEWKAGHINGFGEKIYANGDVYKGEWKEDNKHGQGIFKYKNENRTVFFLSRCLAYNVALFLSFSVCELSISAFEKKTDDTCDELEDFNTIHILYICAF